MGYPPRLFVRKNICSIPLSLQIFCPWIDASTKMEISAKQNIPVSKREFSMSRESRGFVLKEVIEEDKRIMFEFSTFTWIAIFAISAAVINGLGILTIYKNREWAEKTKTYFMCFAAGVLISVPLMSAFPEAVEKNHNAGFFALIGFLFMFFSNKIIQHKTKQKSLAFGITAMQGIAIHSFVDGMIYAVAFNVSILTGFLAGIGLVIHEFAEGVITYSFLIVGGVNKKRAILYAFLISSLTTPLGAFVAYPFVSKLTQSTLGLALGFVVGVLIYISASHLLPEATGHQKKHSVAAFLGGIALALLIVFTHVH